MAHGLPQLPAIGRAMRERITRGRFRALDLSRFGYRRILHRDAIRETNGY